MKKYFSIKVLLTIIVPLFLLVACKHITPAPGGVYEGRQFLLDTDLAIKKAWDSIDNFMKWELINHTEIVRTTPQIYDASEVIRTNAPLWTATIQVTRSNYVWALDHQLSPTQSSNSLQAATTTLISQAALGAAVTKSYRK
jgi:hypothetical protein